MTVSAFLAELRSRDIQVWADGDRLRCNAPPDVLTPELRDRLQQRKNDILEFLRAAGSLTHQPRAIVPLQPHGDRTPIFGVGGHNGDVFCYRYLARHLGDDQPLYGLQPPGLEGEGKPLARVEELAAYFVPQIRACRPDGPYIIAGYCAGGMIAFELARQLRQEGAVISVLALFGAPYPARFRRLALLRERGAQLVERVVEHSRSLVSLPSEERRLYVAERLRARMARRAAERATTQDPALVLRAGVERATLVAGRRYTPGHYAGRVCLFMPSKDAARSRDEPLRWRSVVPHAEEYFGPDGCNVDSMMLEPYAATFAEALRRC
ncbi:MAG TPA: thioesterase domain-containing protein [Gemmatimonadales bacterium]|nr:thioesterase domain-containing protein [Gemmatimonadales bacterium]